MRKRFVVVLPAFVLWLLLAFPVFAAPEKPTFRRICASLLRHPILTTRYFFESRLQAKFFQAAETSEELSDSSGRSMRDTLLASVPESQRDSFALDVYRTNGTKLDRYFARASYKPTFEEKVKLLIAKEDVRFFGDYMRRKLEDPAWIASDLGHAFSEEFRQALSDFGESETKKLF